MPLLLAGPLWLSSAGVERSKNFPPRYAIRLDDLRAWHVIFATCGACQKRTHIDVGLLPADGPARQKTSIWYWTCCSSWATRARPIAMMVATMPSMRSVDLSSADLPHRASDQRDLFLELFGSLPWGRSSVPHGSIAYGPALSMVLVDFGQRARSGR
jgi:hypothetical protein